MFSDHLYLAMDINPSSGLEKYTDDQIIIWPDDFAQNFQATRSYRCTFCKRGFSNAQALGGHMNIHRKDRAKLREFSCENLLSLDITKTTGCEDGPDRIPGSFDSPGECSKPLENQTKKIDQFLDEDDLHKGINRDEIVEENSVLCRLPLFDEAPSGSCASDLDKHAEKTKVEFISYGELDLELRLGPEPNVVSKSKP